MAEKKVSVRLVAENGRQVRAELEGVGNAGAESFKRMSREVDTAGIMLRRLAGIAAGALSIRQVAQYADTWTDLRSRVDLATGSQEKGAAVMDRLAQMARRTYSGIEQTTESWLSNATALRELGLSTAESLDFTEALNNAMVVSGAKGERAVSVQTALARAMALGQRVWKASKMGQMSRSASMPSGLTGTGLPLASPTPSQPVTTRRATAFAITSACSSLLASSGSASTAGSLRAATMIAVVMGRTCRRRPWPRSSHFGSLERSRRIMVSIPRCR